MGEERGGARHREAVGGIGRGGDAQRGKFRQKADQRAPALGGEDEPRSLGQHEGLPARLRGEETPDRRLRVPDRKGLLPPCPGPFGARAHQMPRPRGRGGGRRGAVAVEHGGLDQHIEPLQRLVVGHMFLRLGRQDVGKRQDRRGVGHEKPLRHRIGRRRLGGEGERPVAGACAASSAGRGTLPHGPPAGRIRLGGRRTRGISAVTPAAVCPPDGIRFGAAGVGAPRGSAAGGARQVGAAGRGRSALPFSGLPRRLRRALRAPQPGRGRRASSPGKAIPFESGVEFHCFPAPLPAERNRRPLPRLEEASSPSIVGGPPSPPALAARSGRALPRPIRPPALTQPEVHRAS
ncbi:hypothetical protein CESP606_21315 [Cereibacter sphaeroides]